MSEIQIATDPYWLRWALVGAVGVVNVLIGIIWRSMKKDIEQIKAKQDIDHDRLDKIETHHNIFHKDEIGQ